MIFLTSLLLCINLYELIAYSSNVSIKFLLTSSGSPLLNNLIGFECSLWIQLYLIPNEFCICFCVCFVLSPSSSSIFIIFSSHFCNVLSKSAITWKGCLKALPLLINFNLFLPSSGHSHITSILTLSTSSILRHLSTCILSSSTLL